MCEIISTDSDFCFIELFLPLFGDQERESIGQEQRKINSIGSQEKQKEVLQQREQKPIGEVLVVPN